MHRYHGRQTNPTSPNDHRSMEDHYTEEVSHLEECTDTSVDRPHVLLQLTIDLMEDYYSNYCFKCRRMHIYL